MVQIQFIYFICYYNTLHSEFHYQTYVGNSP